MDRTKYYVYDIESLSNFFSVVFISVDENDNIPHTFIIHESRNDLDKLKEFCNSIKGLVGYNNLHYDWPLLHKVLSKQTVTAEEIYKYSNLIINSDNTSANQYIKQLDLFKMNHFDSDVKRVSLKHLQFAMRYKNVMDMPIHHSSKISVEQIPLILEYNINDVLSTKQFYFECNKEIKVRKTLGKKYDLDLTNASEPKIAKQVFAKILCDKLGIPNYELLSMRTKRDSVKLSDVIFPYVKFKTKEFNSILTFFKSKEIKTLKNAFKNIPVEDYMYLNPKNIKVKRKGKKVFRTIEDMHCVFDGEEYVYGTGGIHSKIKGRQVIPNDDEMILDVDVTSYYPMLAIKNKLKPAHLPEQFNEIYEGIFNERKLYPKSDPSNYVLKIILNSTYGLSNNEYSYLYDPQLTLAITINGQLLISMLIEDIVLNTNSKCVAANTDGASFLIKKNEYEKVIELCNNWEELTKLNLEYAEYDKMFFRDVNNYIWIKEGEKPKLKGIFELKRAWHKNFSQLCVSKALVDYYYKGVPIEESIKNNTDILDFCKEVKLNSNMKLEARGKTKVELSKLTRYVVTNTGDILMKIMPPKNTVTSLTKSKKLRQTNILDTYDLETDFITKNRESNIEASYKCTVYNVHDNSIPLSNLNYDYYIKECKKVIRAINKSNEKKSKRAAVSTDQLQLF